MHTLTRWLIALGLAGACFGASTGYWLAFALPILYVLEVRVILEPRWDMEAELDGLLGRG